LGLGSSPLDLTTAGYSPAFPGFRTAPEWRNRPAERRDSTLDNGHTVCWNYRTQYLSGGNFGDGRHQHSVRPVLVI